MTEAYNPLIARMSRYRRKNLMSSVQCSNPAVAAVPVVPAPRAGMLPLVALAIGFVMAMLDVTVVNVGLSNISENLAAPLSTLVWIVDGYTLTFAAMLMVGGALADRFGAKRLYLTGLFLFVAASLLCGAAPNGPFLVAARLLQGLGAAFFMPSSLSLLSHVYEDDRVRARMLGVWSATVGLSAAVGPLLGGVLIHWLGWRSVFLINVPVGIVGLLMARSLIPQAPRHERALNLYSHVVGVAMLAGVSFVLIQGPVYGWGSARIIAGMALTLLAAVALVRHELRGIAPLLPKALFATPQFAAANGIGFLINFSVYGNLFYLALFLQQGRGADALQTGLQLVPMMAVIFIGNLTSGRMSAHWGPRVPLLLGLSAGAVFTALAMGLTPATPYWLLALVCAAANLGVSTAIPAMTAVVMQVAGRAHANSAAAALNANRQIGALVGVAVMGAVLHTFDGWGVRNPLAFGMMAAAYALALWLVWRFVGVVGKELAARGA
ncbi:DHA2 family methylenomycin A resistance protein-like MFS transporter [Herbaspirillum sp. SJZ130]|nr:DHA2 family methylenomycin A resistance protein-like MFS transporter [Herbaspirillum sp. SJZ130]TQK14439.1 DHA2 family methylenomycin A resistance protein-like MFS transporter [Herbaspirillum sp. SJZ106]TWC66544.1 DHA2 family methylenomycin A resistance protein-like MFS transporter [Herbaspirillum sp. SJZ099]